MTEPNIDHPGWPNYTGPEVGFFSFPWHRELIVYMPSYGETIAERVEEIKTDKPKHEIAHRLACIVHIPDDRLPKGVVAAGNQFDIVWRQYETEILAVINELVSGHTWNGKELVFREGGTP